MLAAVDLYQGPYLDGFYTDWALLEQERLREVYLRLLGFLLEHNKQSGDYAAALTVAQRLVFTEPLHEAAHRELMHLYHLLGRNAEAIAQYQRCREILQDELGVDPAPETKALYSTLARRAPPQAHVPTIHLPTRGRRPLPDLDALPLVGRDTERRDLLGHLEASAAGKGGIILLEGEAGIGKTRLVLEIIAGARWRNIETTLACATEAAASTSYALLLAALSPLLRPLRIRQLARITEAIHLQTVTPLLPCVAQALPELSPPTDLPPTQARERLQQALLALILGLSRIAPHFWVLEDIQRADAESLALLPALQRQLPENQALFLLTGRSRDLRANPTLWETLQSLHREGPLSQYTLGRLSADDLDTLLRDVLDEENPTLTRYLAQESEGVPLYLVEILKAWRDEGSLQPTERGAWRMAIEIPGDLPFHLGEAVIGYRLSRLSPDAREVLAAAATIGTSVDLDLLTMVCFPHDGPPNRTVSDPRLLDTTDELLLLGLLIERDEGYHFSHERVRQAVYSRLPSDQRQRLHHRIAQALEALAPDQFELLARHYDAAGEHEPAARYLSRAAKRARSLFAHQAALVYHNRLLELLTEQHDRPARYDALRDRAEVLGWIGEREAQGHTLQEMLTLARALSDESRLAEALHRRSEWHRIQGQYRPAEEDALQALEIYRRLGDDRAQAALLSQLGWILVYTANHVRSVEYFQQALSIYASLGDAEGQFHSLIGLISAAELGGDYSLSYTYSQRCMDLAQATGNPDNVGRALFGLGLRHLELGNLEAAEAHLRQSLQICQTIGARRRQAATNYYLAEVAAERGDLEAARAKLDLALEQFGQVRDLSWEGDVHAALGRLALLRDDPAAAEKHLRFAYQRRQELEEVGYAVIDLSYIALAELALGEEAAAWQHSREAVAQLEAGLSGVERPYRVYYNHFLVAEGTRHWASARAALETAAHILTTWGSRLDDPELRKQFLTGTHTRRAIMEAIAKQPPPGRLRVRLARTGVPAHRRPTPAETTTLTWTLDAGEADVALAEQADAVALRRHRLLRLVAEAETAVAAPTVTDLAGALDVSPRTIRSDLAALRRQGHTIRTRGYRPGRRPRSGVHRSDSHSTDTLPHAGGG